MTHTRLPRYVRGRAGTIESLHGCHVFPDTNALGEGENPQWLYTVRFNARDLCGPDADPNLYPWMHGSHIWSRPSKPPKIYCASLRIRLRRKGVASPALMMLPINRPARLHDT